MILYINKRKIVCMCRCSKRCHNKRNVLDDVIEYVVTCFRILIKGGQIKHKKINAKEK